MPTFRDDLHLGHSVPMVDTEDIVDGAITEPKLADDSVSTRTIQDGAVTEPKIAEKAVTEPKLADAAVSTRTIKFRAVTESKIGDSAVSTRTIQNGAVTNPKIANGAVSMSKLNNEVQTLIQQGASTSLSPMGEFDIEAIYWANDMVYDSVTNSSYVSLRADNMGHPVTDETWWMKVLDGSYVNLLEEELQQLVDSISEGTQQQVEELNEALEALEAQADQSRQDIQDIVDSLAVVQTTGQSASDVMSQKAVTDEIINLYASSIWTSTNNAIRNGSVGNPGNTICVAVTYIINVSNLKSLKLVTNRPNSTNCVYRWVYTTFSTTRGYSYIQTDRIRQFDAYLSANYPSEFELQEQEVGFAFGVLEWNTVTNTASALRVGDFSGYVIGFEGVKKELKYDYPVLQEGTSLTLDLFKMNVGSLQASGVISSVYGGAFTSFPIELTTTQSITVTLPTTTIGETEIVPQLRIAEFDSVDCKNGSLIYNATPSDDYTFTPTKKYIRIHLGWFDGQDMLTIKNGFGGLQISSASKLRVLDIPTRQLPVFPFKDVTYIPSSSVRTGSVGNIGNSYSVSTRYVIPTHGHKYAMIYTSYKPQDGCVLKFTSIGLTVDNGKSEVASNVAANRVFYGDYGYGNNIISDVSDAIGIAFSVVEYNLSTGTYTGRDALLSALNEEHFGIILFDEHTSIAPYLDKDAILNASVTELNGANNVKNLLAQATRYPRVGQAQKTKPLSLLHFSDMHGSASALRRIIAFKNEWASYINDILDTGDTIYLRYSNDWTWFTNISGSENILMTIGNHDALAATSGWDWTNLITPQQGYERYMAGIANWGVTYQVNKTYYYKDYSTEKIRLIVLDCMLWDSTQLEWLTNTLASAKTAGLAVVCVSHYPPLMNGLDNCSFNSPRVTNDSISNEAIVAVDNFISSNGHFIAWVCGHTHNDKFGTVQDYPNQTVVVVDTCATDADNLAYSDIARVDRTKSQDLFNIISFDTWNKRIKILRIGADYDFMMRHKGTLCWDYANQKLLWNT